MITFCHCGWQALYAETFCDNCNARVTPGAKKTRLQWHSWAGTSDGAPTMWSIPLFVRFGFSIQLHKMVGVDAPDCFHSHPAIAIRILLWGGYYEEPRDEWLIRPHDDSPGVRALILFKPPFGIGIVRPNFWHRIYKLYSGNSYSLWIRFRKVQEAEAEGEC